MRSLRETDGSPPHRRAARHHMAKCRKGKTALHTQLQSEMSVLYKNLVSAARATEDAQDDYIEAAADTDSAEIAFENVIRDLDADLGKLDRDNPTLNARGTVFPGGFGQEIDPEGEDQLSIIAGLKTRLGAFASYPLVSDGLARLNAAENDLRTCLAVEETASTRVDELFAAENEARRMIREQLQSAYGRLRDLYKTRPILAEQFFLRDLGSRRTAKKKSA